MVVMDDTGICIPDAPMAKIDDDLESNGSVIDK